MANSNRAVCFDKVVCLTLATSRKRQELVAAEFHSVAIADYEFFVGYDADSPEVADCYASGKVKRYPNCFRCGHRDCGDAGCNNILIPAQVAVVLGFRAIFAYVVDSGARTAMICEDDIVFASYAKSLLESPDFARLVQQSGLASDRPALIRLAAPMGDAVALKSRVWPGVLALGREIVMSNPCFLVNRSFAQLAHTRLAQIDHTADVIVHDHLASRADCWTLNQQLVCDRSWYLGEVPSLIHPKLVHLAFLEKNGQSNTPAFLDEQDRLEKHLKKAVCRDYAIVGSPRCGSHYVAAFLARHGMQVTHESLGSQGICAWQFSVSDRKYPYITDRYAASDFFVHFDRWLMYVRNPFDAIPSLMVENQKAPLSFHFRSQHIEKRFGVRLGAFANAVERALVSYCYWNLLALERNPDTILRVETLPQDCSRAFPGIRFEPQDISPLDRGAGKPYFGFSYPPTPLDPDWMNQVSAKNLKLLESVSSQLGYSLVSGA